jgi:quercetin dioxygenase-like cupin family protein/DNA-binding XRE family transcriptional regulator
MTKTLTLKELARRSECSESLLSKVENGHALPSLALVHRLVHVLETNISWLFEEKEPNDSPVSRAGARPIVTLDDRPGDAAGVTFERIIPYRTGHLLQSNIHHLAVGGSSGQAITHDGEETGYVLCGEVELTLDNVSYVLNAGDSFCFPSSTPHSYRNIGNEHAAILWTCTPPTF